LEKRGAWLDHAGGSFMQKTILALSFFLFLTRALLAEEPSENRTGIQIIPVQSTPQPINASIRIALPEDGQLLSKKPVVVTLRVRGFALGQDSNFPRENELPVSKMGQTVHVFVDDRPYFAYNGPAMDPFEVEGDFYQANYQFDVNSTLKEGMHTVRILPCRSYGESLKSVNCFDAIQFFLKDKKMDWAMSLRRPFLTFNEPSGNFPYRAGEPILLDFYVSNCELSSDGYKIKLTVDGRAERYLSEWIPYYILGLKPGKHQLRLELVDGEKQLVPGAFNDVERTFSVK